MCIYVIIKPTASLTNSHKQKAKRVTTHNVLLFTFLKEFLISDTDLDPKHKSKRIGASAASLFQHDSLSDA